jgi:hypothetical protein
MQSKSRIAIERRQNRMLVLSVFAAAESNR